MDEHNELKKENRTYIGSDLIKYHLKDKEVVKPLMT
jgi:hypothetical protein